jgi:hypothetical protein
LAGQVDGTSLPFGGCNEDSALLNSPVDTLLSFVPGQAIQISSVSGQVYLNNYGSWTPNAGGITNATGGTGSTLGLSAVTGPIGGLVGVFLASGLPNANATPTNLNFSANYWAQTTITPLLQQTFFIGSGTNSSGNPQNFIVPSGATRLLLGVLDSYNCNGENYGSYQVSVSLANTDSVGDGIPDWWRSLYFGGSGTTTNNQNCATCDADGTGQNNLFKYVAGLDPTDPASVFALVIQSVPSQPTQMNLTYGPITSGRTYTLQSRTNMVSGTWNTQDISDFQIDGSQVTVTDANATQPNKFYRIEISLP